MAAFASAERLTRVASSVLVRSLIDRKCRGIGAAVCIERSLIIAILMTDRFFLARVARWGEKEGTVKNRPRKTVRSVDAMVGKWWKPQWGLVGRSQYEYEFILLDL